MNCLDCGTSLVSGEDQFADSWICPKCNKTVPVSWARRPREFYAAAIRVTLEGKIDSHVGLEEREAKVLMERARQQGVPAARVLLHALRVFDLYLAGRLKMETSDSPGCGVIE